MGTPVLSFHSFPLRPHPVSCPTGHLYVKDAQIYIPSSELSLELQTHIFNCL